MTPSRRRALAAVTAWALCLAASLTVLDASRTSAQWVDEPPASAASVSPASEAAVAEKVRRFWAKDKHFYRSRWYAAKHRKMIPFGCTKAPYYSPSPRCTDEQGFHHGLDIAMPCGTSLFSGLRGTIVRPHTAGSLGSAYGPYAFRIRSHRLNLDFVIGHVKRVFVEPGDHVARGDLIARASDQGAPDGCHLHFEARPQGESYEAAVNPTHYLHLRRVVSQQR